MTEFSLEEVQEVAMAAAGAASGVFMEMHPDTEMPSGPVIDAVRAVVEDYIQRVRPQGEVTHSEYVSSCEALSRAFSAMKQAPADEVAEHYLPFVTRELMPVFAFVGANMTARHMGAYGRTVVAYERSKHGGVGAMLHAEPQRQEEQNGRQSAAGTAGTPDDGAEQRPDGGDGY